jgi:cell division septum initiation protein DivIVA
MAYKDFSMNHYEQLIKEKEEATKQVKELREQLNSKDDMILEKDNLIYSQNIRLKNYDEAASKAQQSGGSVVGLMNKLLHSNN